MCAIFNTFVIIQLNACFNTRDFHIAEPMTPNDLLTKKDLEDFKKELYELLAPAKGGQPTSQPQWLRTKEVTKMLKISGGMIQTLRINGTLPYSKIGGIYYYKYEDIQTMLEKAQKKSPKSSRSTRHAS